MITHDLPLKDKIPVEISYTLSKEDDKSNLFEVTKYSIKCYVPSTKHLSYFFEGTVISVLPDNLRYLLPNIDKSKSMLHLKENWDDEGSDKYEKTTWIASIKFLLDYARTLFEDFNIKIQTPKIYPGPKGSIDIMWEVEKYRLVVNIDKNGEDAMFYADNYKDQVNEGMFKLNNFNIFLLPLAIQL